MHNLILFTASYINDLDRLEILKASVDRFNVDRIPFYIVVPQQDLDAISRKIVTGTESYELKLISDDKILKSPDELKDGWRRQQVVKLSFWELGLTDFYAIIDSDVYFIRDFHVSDFLKDEKTPFLYMREIFRAQDDSYAKNYFGRTGKTYTFVGPAPVFSRFVLEDMKKNVLEQNGLNWNDLIRLSPWEYQWYGEYFLKCRIHELLPMTLLVKSFSVQIQYVSARLRGYTEADFISQGYIAILMQNRWVRDKVYKPVIWAPLVKLLRNVVRKFI